MSVLHIRLLGDFHLAYADAPVTGVNTPRLQSLLAYLLLHRDTPQRRQHLAFLFWPDSSEAQALTNLRNLLHKLREALPDPEGFLLADSLTVQWRPDASFTCDVADFVSLAHATTRADLEQAINLYGGDLLRSCYDDWIALERERLQQTAIRACERLVALLEEQRDYRAAIGYARRLRQLDPVRETTYRTLMRLHAADNDRTAALRVYHTCVTTLQSELAAEPAPETRELYQRLLSTTTAPPFPVNLTQHQPPLVGRQAEWKALQDAWYAASSGKPHCMLVTGEAGIGKTRLAEDLLTWISRQGFAGAVARCYAAEGALAYAPVIAWLRSPALRQRLLALDPVWATEAARALPELLTERPNLIPPAPLAENAQRQRLFEALARATLKPGEPLLLWMDDMQWCDRDSLEWLRYLLHFDPAARLLVLGTIRTEELADDHPLNTLWPALRRDGQLTSVALGPLTAEETESLAAHLVETALTHAQAMHLFQETEGNPLFVVEMMRSVQEGGAQETALGAQQTARPPLLANSPPLPPKVHAVLHARLAQISADARELAGLAAAIGREFTLPVLARASDQEEDALVASLDELWQRRIVRDAPGRSAEAYDFTHDKLREVAYNSLSAARRRWLHRRIAQALEAEHSQTLAAVSGQVANHLELAGRLEEAVPYYLAAAESARRLHANAEAIRYYGRGLALLQGTPARSQPLAAKLYEQLGETLHWTGEYANARASFQQALASVPGMESIQQARLHRKIGNTWREEYGYTEALRAYAAAEQALGESPPGEDPTAAAAWWQEWIQVSLEVIHVYYWLGRVDESDELRPRLQTAVAQYGTPGQRAHHARSMGWLEFRRNRSVATAEMVDMARAVLAAQQEAGNQADIPSAQFGVGFALLWSGDPQGAVAPLQAALSLTEETGDITLQARCLAYLSIAFRQREQMEEARQTAAQAYQIAMAAHMPEYVGTATANQAWLAWRSDDLLQTQELGHAALAAWRQLPVGHASAPFQWLALFPLMAAALQQDQVSLAVDYARALLDPAQQRLPDPLTTSLEQTVSAWARGERRTAQSTLHQIVNLARQLRYL